MKTMILLCLVSAVAVSMAFPDGDRYTDKYDNVDLDEILTNKRLLLPYVKCALDQGKCSPDGKELKEHIKEALETYCEKCTEKQKEGTKKVIKHLINHESELWEQLVDKYDHDRKFVMKYEDELKQAKE